MESFYRLKITVGKIAFEIESHDQEWVKEKEAKLMGELFSDPERVARLASKGDEPESPPPNVAIKSKLTIHEFYKKYVSGRNWPRTKIALMVIYYLDKYLSQESITSSQVKKAFQEIGYPKYDKLNYTDILNQLKRSGYLNKIGKDWRLTITGQDYVLSQIGSK